MALERAVRNTNRFSCWPLSGRGRRTVGLCLATLLVFPPSTAGAQSEALSADEAAEEIQEARDAANEAAVAYFEAESVLAGLQDDLMRLETQTAQLQRSVDEMEFVVAAAAAQRFVQSGSTGIPILTDIDSPSDHVQASAFIAVGVNNGFDVLDEYGKVGKDLEASMSDLADQRTAVEEQREMLERLQREAEAEVDRLREVERERLTDEAVQRSLAARLATERAQVKEQARLDAEAAARAAPNPGLSDSAVAPTTTIPNTPGALGDGESTEGRAALTPPVEPAPPATTGTTNDGPSGGTSGGRTGVSGPGSSPSGYDSGDGYIDVIACPITGSAYGDTWGAARSGGRRHQGVDMIAPAGVPIYAVTDGYVTFKQNRLGGNAASLLGDNGNRYYFAHFSRYEGSSRRVSAGDIIGYNGRTGNTTTNHLHFELRPGAGANVNPYPSVRFAGC